EAWPSADTGEMVGGPRRRGQRARRVRAARASIASQRSIAAADEKPASRSGDRRETPCATHRGPRPRHVRKPRTRFGGVGGTRRASTPGVAGGTSRQAVGGTETPRGRVAEEARRACLFCRGGARVAHAGTAGSDRRRGGAQAIRGDGG